MSAPIEAVLLGAGDRGYYCHGMFAQRYPHKLCYVAVAEPNAALRDRFGDLHNLPQERRFASWQDLLAAGQLAPALVNTTPDRVHASSTVAALEAGYHVLLEKPMATSALECVQIVRAAERAGRTLQVHHGMRYAPYTRMIYDIIASGRLGRIMEYGNRENVAFFHMAHAYVRGNWRRVDTSGPMILTKSCHDLDLMVWFTGSRCQRVFSTGSLRYYRAENAPPEAPGRCTDGCPVESDCPYYAPRFYLSDEYIPRIFAQALTTDLSKAGILQALKTGPYGRCVFHSDNDVVDQQSTILEMENGTRVNFSLHGFSHDGGRSVRLQGTAGTLIAEALNREIIVHDHLTGRKDVIQPGKTAGGHGGGDDGLLSAFVQTLRTGEQEVLTSARASLESHLMAFAAEESRLTGQPVEMEDFRQAVENQTQAAEMIA